MNAIAPRSAARRLASELKLPSWKGTVLDLIKGDAHVLVVAADKRWLMQANLPKEYCGYRVLTDEPLNAQAHKRKLYA